VYVLVPRGLGGADCRVLYGYQRTDVESFQLDPSTWHIRVTFSVLSLNPPSRSASQPPFFLEHCRYFYSLPAFSTTVRHGIVIMNVSLPVRLKFRHLHIRLYRVLRAENLGVPMYSNVESSNQTIACSFDIIRVLANPRAVSCVVHVCTSAFPTDALHAISQLRIQSCTFGTHTSRSYFRNNW